MGTDAPTARASVAEPPVVTDVGVNVAATPAGTFDALRLIVSGVPETSVVWIEVWPVAPCWTERDEGCAPIEKLFGGGGAVVGSWTVSKTAVLAAVELCEVTAIPASNVPATPNGSLVPGIGVQVDPSGEVYAVTIPPLRSTDTYAGTTPAMFASVCVWPPAAERWSTQSPDPGVTRREYSGDAAFELARSITPARARLFVFVCDTTLAVMPPSPPSGCQT